MDQDEIIERGRDVQEMEKSPGWKAVKDQLELEISSQEDEIKRIEIAGRRPEDIGAEYIAAVQRVSGFRRVSEIIESMKEDRTRAEQEENHG